MLLDYLYADMVRVSPVLASDVKALDSVLIEAITGTARFFDIIHCGQMSG